MIQINLLSTERQALNAAVARTRAALRNRSFSARNPQLGRMINCQVCSQRHRENYQCAQSFAKPRYVFQDDGTPIPTDERPDLVADQTTFKGVYGAQAVHKKRLLPHHNRRDLLLVQRTIELYPEHAVYLAEPKEAMREARLQAQREIARAQDLRSGKQKRLKKISKRSRRINRRK